MGRNQGELRVGTSGYQYRHWRGHFYPGDLPSKAWFDHCAERFDSVEINNTFYNLPEPQVFDESRGKASLASASPSSSAATERT